MRSSRALTLALVAGSLCAAASLPAGVARADAIDACVSAAATGQELQRQGHLRDARARFLECVRPACPGEVTSVCDQLLAATEASLPTLIFAARDGQGADILDVRVFLDGRPLVASLDGKAVAVDPGPHTLRFEHAGSVPAETRMLVREAEKNREVTLTFPASPPPVASPPPHPPVLAYIFGAVGVASLGGFTYLLVHGQSQFDACTGNRCSASTLHGLEVERGLAYGALGLGVASLGVAAWSFLTHRVAPRPAAAVVRLSVGATSMGGNVAAEVSF